MFAVEVLSFFICYLLIAVSVGAQGPTYNPKGCDRDKFPCDDGACINKNGWCDSVIDCPDGSDEQYCRRKRDEHDFNPNKCTMKLFRCSNGLCIPWNGKCDGINTCGDGSDEYGCTMRSNVPTRPITENHLEMPVEISFSNTSYEDNSINRIQKDFNDEYDDEWDALVYDKERIKAKMWLLSQRKNDYSWGDDTERAIVALSLSDSLDLNTMEGKLMTKQLHIRLSIALARNKTKTIMLCELALYINALKASCGDPRNFYGFDLVSKLRERVDAEHHRGKFSIPSVYLTLCMNNATTPHDVQVLRNMFLHRNDLAKKSDFQAIALLATRCMEMDKTLNPRDVVDLKRELIKNIGGRLTGNIYEVALVIQAFYEAQKSPEFWNRDEAIKFVLSHQDNTNGSFGDILATYYALPVLAGTSLLSLGSNCNKSASDELTPLEILKNSNKRLYVSYGIYYGQPMEMSQTMILKVSPGTTFFDIMRLAQEKNRNYRFSLDESKDRPTVYSIGGVPNDAEKGIYWTLHLKENPQNLGIRTNLTLIDTDLRKLVPKGGEDIIFWWKPF